MKLRNFLVIGVALLVGVFIGRGCGSGPARSQAPDSATPSAPAVKQVWTCSMHPQVRLDGPGSCPICEMPLILAEASGSGDDDAPSLQLSAHAIAMANIETTPVERRPLTHELRAVGKIQYNEASLATITARVAGYAERLFVDITGVDIAAGDHLAEIYSPDLAAAQQEMLIALQQGGAGASADAMAQATRTKLLRWGLAAGQVQALERERVIAERITLLSPIAGTVIERNITRNSAFAEGDVLYRIANLDTVWAILEVYESDLPWIRYGQKVELKAEALPGRIFEGRATFVQPLVDERSRTIRIPVHVENPDHALKPGMFVSAVVKAALGADGAVAPTGVEGQFSCPMHPQFLDEAPGECPSCGMPTVRIPGGREATADAAAVAAETFFCPMKCEGDKTYPAPGNCPVCEMKLERAEPGADVAAPLAVPATAVLDSGTRTLVYVEREDGQFEPREVVLGPRAGADVPVIRGVAEGERVVTRGGFLLDSQFQISGRPSLFYPGGLLGDRIDAPEAEAAEAGAGAHEPAAHAVH